jgi:hypothetical protein
MKRRPCAWLCGRTTDRISGICVFCIDDRDKAPWVPPGQRPNHRFHQRKQLNTAQKESLNKARMAKRLGQTPGVKLFGHKEG